MTRVVANPSAGPVVRGSDPGACPDTAPAPDIPGVAERCEPVGRPVRASDERTV